MKYFITPRYIFLTTIIGLILSACGNQPKIITETITIQESEIDPGPPPSSFLCTNPLTLKEWFINFSEKEKPLYDSVSYNFQLFSTDSCLVICLTKLTDIKHYSNGTTSNEINLNTNYYPLSNTEYKTLDWRQRLEKIKLQLKECIESGKSTTSSLKKVKYLSINFDDGTILKFSW